MNCMTASAETPNWFAVHTRSQKESVAERELQRLGFNTFYPHVSEWVALKTHRSRLVKRAYFSRYLFVQSVRDMLYRVNDACGVSCIVYAAGQEPFPIPQEVMQVLFDKADHLGEVYEASPSRARFEGLVGDTVRFAEHNPLWGLAAEILKVVDNDKIIVKLEQMFGAEREIQIAPTDVGKLVKRQ